MTSQRTFGALLGWMIALDMYTNAVSECRFFFVNIQAGRAVHEGQVRIFGTSAGSWISCHSSDPLGSQPTSTLRKRWQGRQAGCVVNRPVLR